MKMQIFKFASALFLSLIACSSVVVESQEQTYPYMTFLYENQANHSYVNITELGDMPELSVQCHTDLISCCTSSQGPIHRGDWYFPNGTRMNFTGGGMYQNRNLQRTDLRRENDVVSPTGIYRCGIPTIAVHNDSDGFLRANIYIGVYTSSGGNIGISDGVALDVTSDLNGPSPQFTLTCISTDGPATTVTWTRDSTILTEGSSETVLNDTVTAQYIHTLTLTGRLPGLYTCTVSNNKPSSDSQSINLEVGSTPTDLTASRTDPSHTQVNWTPPPSPNGYIIFYTDTAVGSTTDNVTISGGSVNGYFLSGLSAGAEYNITLFGTSQHFFSDPISVVVPVLPPNNPSITYITSTKTTITLTWSMPSPSAVTEYIVKWQKITTGCPNEDAETRVITTTDLSHSDTITELQKGSNYSVSVTARNPAGNSTSEVVSITTEGDIPSGAPSDVTLINVTENSMTFQWGPLPCIHRNGEITSYIITYNEQGYLDTSKTESVPSTLPDAGGILTISGLVAEVAYNVRIAAVNMNGTATNTSGFNVITTGIRNDVCTYSSTTYPHNMTTSVSSSSSAAYESTSAPPPTQETVTMADDRDNLSTRDILITTSVDIISSTPLVETTTIFVTVTGQSSCSKGSNGIGLAVGAGAGVAVAIIILLAGGGVLILFLRKTYRQRRNKYSLRDNNMSMKTNMGINMAYGMTPSKRETVIDEDNETEYEVINNQYAHVGPPPDLPSHNLVGPPPDLPSRHLTASYEIHTPPNIRQLRVKQQQDGMEQTEKTSQVHEEEKEDKELYTEVVNNT